MNPDERELGRLIGRVDTISEQLAEMRQVTARENAALMTKLDLMRDEINAKASKTWLKEIEKRTDKLESIADQGTGAARLGRALQGALYAAAAIIGLLIGQGGLG